MPSWVNLSSQIGANKPAKASFFQSIYDNLELLKSWLGGSYTLGPNHSHNGTDSAYVASVADGSITEAKLASSIVGTAKLKVATGSFTDNNLPDTGTAVTAMHAWAHIPSVGGANSPLVNWGFEQAPGGGVASGVLRAKCVNVSGAAATAALEWIHHQT